MKMNSSCRFILATSMAAVVVGMSGCSDFGRPLSEVTPALAVNDVAATEPGQVQFIVSLTRAADGDVTFEYTTAPGTAFSLTDYTTESGQGMIPEGQLSFALTVDVLDDTVNEGSENFTLVISHASGAQIADQSGSCTIAPNDGSTATVSFAGQIQPMLNNYCVGCHGGAAMENGFSVSTHANILTTGISGPNVIPGDGDNSLLYRITTTNYPLTYPRMPQGGPFLSTNQQLLIKTWIDEGALDN